MNFTEHFTLLETYKSATADRLDIDNTPPASMYNTLRTTALNILEPPRRHYGIPFSPSSFYRCLDLNRALKSKDTSQHLKGQAVDFEIPGIDNLALAYWMIEHVDFDQLILEFYTDDDPASGWVHGSYVSAHDNRQNVLTIWKGGRITEGLP